MKKQSLENQAKNIVMEKLIKLIDKEPDKDGKFKLISSNPNLTMELIDKYPNKPWDWKWGISKNPNITIEIINKI